jgi:hypothetical protein
MRATGPPEPQPDDHSAQASPPLPTRLDNAAEQLNADYQDSTRSWPDPEEDVLTYWRGKTEKIKQDIDLVQRLADLSRKAVEGKAEPEPLRDLDDSLLQARIAVHAALRAFQAPHEAAQATPQTEHYFKAATHLRHLAPYCQSMATHLRGMQGLPDMP